MQKTKDWKSFEDIKEILNGVPGRDRLEYLYILRLFWKNCFFAEGYKADSEWEKMLVFSKEGKNLIEHFIKSELCDSSPDLILAIFRIFSFHELFLSWEDCDIDSIQALLEHEILSSKIHFPYRFGRLLYDKFNDTYDGSRTDHLPAIDSAKLIEETPVGVYQLGNLLIGKLGCLKSKDFRYIPPSLSLPLWHCSDTGCQTKHDVKLICGDSTLLHKEHQLLDYLRKKYSTPSEWDKGLKSLTFRRKGHSTGLKFYDLAVLIADCIVCSERTKLLEHILKSEYGNEIRLILSSPPRKKNEGIGPPNEISKRLTAEEQLQLLMVLPDSVLINMIDSVVDIATIKIPVGQIRKTKNLPSLPSLSPYTELSSFGLRSISDSPVVSLVSLIEKSYSEAGLRNDLEWRLRSPSGISLGEALFNYLKTYGPEKAVRELILSSHQITKIVARELNIVLADYFNNYDLFTNKILWKMNFDPPQYDDFSQRFLQRLDQFNEAVLQTSNIRTEEEREKIRAGGVNLFVSVEEFIDLLLCYNVWLIASDHFIDTKFVFNIDEARKKVALVLGETLQSDDENLTWNLNGENPLGVLLRYISESISWLNSLQEKDRDKYIRNSQDIPHFASKTIQKFPFRHTCLWADSEPQKFKYFIEGYTSIVTLLQQASLAGVRNGLDHMREPDRFPPSDAMLACISKLRQVHNLADAGRYIPKLCWLQDFKQNRFGVEEFVLRDSKSCSLVIYGPSMCSGLMEIGFNKPIIMSPINLLGEPNSQLMFTIKETTEYDKYWEGYPKRRFIPSNKLQQGIEEK